MSQVRGVHGEKNQRRPLSGAVRARRAGVFVQIQGKYRKGGALPRNSKVRLNKLITRNT